MDDGWWSRAVGGLVLVVLVEREDSEAWRCTASPNAEIHDDETAMTATAVLARAVEWFNNRGVTVERVLADNGDATGPTSGETPAWLRASGTSAPGPTDAGPTARSSGSTAHWRMARPTPAAIPRKPHDAASSTAGCTTTTTTTAPIAPAAIGHPSHRVTDVPGQYI